MHHGGFMQRVEFLVVHLPGVQERGGRCSQAFGAAPDLCLRLVAPAGGDGAQAVGPEHRRSGDANADAVEDEDLCGAHGLGRQVLEARGQRVFGETGGGGHGAKSLRAAPGVKPRGGAIVPRGGGLREGKIFNLPTRFRSLSVRRISTSPARRAGEVDVTARPRFARAATAPPVRRAPCRCGPASRRSLPR